MTHDDIIRMAREAGFLGYESRAEEVRNFAALVAAHTLSNIDPSSFMSYQEGFEAGAAAEREACARVCDKQQELTGAEMCCVAMNCADAIRARSEK